MSAPTLERPAPAAPPPARAPRRRPDGFRVFGWAVSALVCVAILYPLVIILGDVLGIGEEPSMAGEIWSEATSEPALETLRTTVLLVVPAGVAALLIASLLAWVNERTDARIGLLADVTPILPMFIPPVAGAIGWVFLAAPSAGLLNGAIEGFFGLFGADVDGPLNIFTWQGLFFVYVLDLVPFAYITLAAGFRNLDPVAEEAARISGAGPLETFRRVTLPSLGPSIGGALLIVMAIGFALFSTPIVIGTQAGVDVLSIEVVEAMTRSFPAEEAKALGYGLLLLLMVTLAWLLQRRFVRGGGHATVGGKGLNSQPTRLGPFRHVARAFMVLYLLGASVLPILALVIVSLERFWTASVPWGDLTLDNYRNLLSNAIVVDALRNSVIVGVCCATIGMALAAVVARITHGETSRWTGVVEGVTRVPAAVPILVLSLAFIAAFVGEPFRIGGTTLLLVLAYTVIFFPHAVVNASSAYLQVGPQLREAGAVFGVSEGRTFLRVQLPLMLPGLTSGWAFLFVLVAGDVTVASLLAGTGNPVAGFVILDRYNTGTYPPLAAMAVLTTLLTTVVVTLALLFSRWQRNRTTAGVRRRAVAAAGTPTP
ncbi:ABC transporter permease subunit [Nocardioides zeae]|uniref:ABC transporter permease subunit n=1 Tax=Nocardioides imazamoxiresistens TaxID=3231893 RepID=A0ABU3PR54_9ACTN|nr:ABC transporter permease subunit [Nocardioides zeae]MDT9591708.1 ABC transporter permease subunit [Nocardioides zeae]